MTIEEFNQLSEISSELFLLSDTLKALEALHSNTNEPLPKNALAVPVCYLCELTEKLDCLVETIVTGKE